MFRLRILPDPNMANLEDTCGSGTDICQSSQKGWTFNSIWEGAMPDYPWYLDNVNWVNEKHSPPNDPKPSATALATEKQLTAVFSKVLRVSPAIVTAGL